MSLFQSLLHALGNDPFLIFEFANVRVDSQTRVTLRRLQTRRVIGIYPVFNVLFHINAGLSLIISHIFLALVITVFTARPFISFITLLRFIEATTI